MIKSLKKEGYYVKAERFPNQLTSDFDIIVVHPDKGEASFIIKKFHEENPDIPLIFCSRIFSNKIPEYSINTFFRKYIDSEREFGKKRIYECGCIGVKPFLKFIKYLTGKIPKFNTNI